MLVAQLSDLHFSLTPILGGQVDTAQMTRRAVDAVLRLEPLPDVVLITGDLTENGSAEEYEALLDVLGRMPMPIYAVPGNHDRREPFRRTLSRRCSLPACGALNVVADVADVRLIGLDTLVEGESYGRLDADSLSFLASALFENPKRPTLVFMHHPPVACGIRAMDAIRLLEGAEELATLLAHHDQVERLVCGHVHRSIQSRFAHTICQIAPSVAHQVSADLADPVGIRATLEPAAFMLHRFVGDCATTHLVFTTPAPLVVSN